jgi:hypothetical protein
MEFMSDDTEQLRQDFEICTFFSLQMDESADVCDVFLLLVFV